MFSDEIVSPELALVDPELARAARARLPDPAAAPRASRDRGAGEAAANSMLSTPAELEQVDAHVSRRLLVGVAAATMLSLLLFDVRVEVGELPAAAESELETPAPAPKPRASRPVRPKPPASRQVPKPPAATSSPSRPREAAPSERRFAWAPTAEASGYYVEFFRGTARVYARETTRPTLEIPARWRYGGVERSFQPGVYSWYVWPVVGGKRAARAAVQTTVSIPRS